MAHPPPTIPQPRALGAARAPYSLEEQTTEPAERDRPDPVQPLETEMGQAYHPYNAGKYASHYLVGNLAVTAWF